MLNALTAAVLALSAAVPPPSPVTIEVLSLKGDGCAAGSAAVAMSLDNQAFTVTYSDFIVQAHGSDVRRTCEISLRVNHPDDYTYGIAQTDYRGFAHIGAGSRGIMKGHYFFPGMPTRHSSHTYPGPLSDNWQATDQLPPGDVLHGPCRQRKPLAVNAELRVVGKSATSFMTMDSTDSSVSSTFRLSWRKC
ncbi:DUF4360 domain-containing protein [Kibdelosporangium aridum]|uniref:DUF4360 domain-containing protein n=1 Tax=Kibdelosporangium aridum TaxID=2030 RepID=UPI0005242BAF